MIKHTPKRAHTEITADLTEIDKENVLISISAKSVRGTSDIFLSHATRKNRAVFGCISVFGIYICVRAMTF